MTSSVRTRFAPSPTGYLHIGGARTALFCWLYARKMGGTFILRIEDTDLERSTPESVQAILDSMAWLQLDYDEGPFYQTAHFERYKSVIEQLLQNGQAYRCYCTKERLEALREQQIENKEKPRYDGHCRAISEIKDQPFVVRFKNPDTGVVEFNDLVRGKLTFANQELDDLIIARTDGTPTYNFTVVVDDWDMKITHVIRGDDHINNTPRQINILKALGATLPHYAHVPMILGSDGKRLSKRHGAVGVQQYQEDGFLPHALRNYLVRLGWSHGDQEIFSLEELIQLFDIENVNRAPGAYNPEKLLWLNHHYIKASPKEEIIPELMWHFEKMKINVDHGPDLIDLIHVQAERCKTLKEMAEKSRYFYEDVECPAEFLHHLHASLVPPFQMVMTKLADMPIWSKEGIHELLNQVAEIHGLKLGKLAQPLRIALTSGVVSPSIDTTILLLGREKTLARLEKAIDIAVSNAN